MNTLPESAAKQNKNACRDVDRAWGKDGGPREFCATHKEEGMVNLKNQSSKRTCEDCGSTANYGLPAEGTKRWCAEAQQQG